MKIFSDKNPKTECLDEFDVSNNLNDGSDFNENLEEENSEIKDADFEEKFEEEK